GKSAKSAPGIMEVGWPDMTGEKTISKMAEASPPTMDQTAPWVVNFFQNSEYRMVGRLAEAATAKASATRKATFCPWAPMPPTIAKTPMTTTVRRATFISFAGVLLPLAMTEEYTSWAKDAAAVMVSPATTARIVAKATAEIRPSSSGPPSSK